ncbi:MAG: glycosyltransferase family 4 protein [Clostridia bacterium]|nr:glycosyltransferase family 4 protein [Clostridia bacterium]
MKIAFSMANMLGGGAERVVSELANSFVEQGHDVSIIVMKASECVYPLKAQVKLVDLSAKDKGIFSRVRALRQCIKKNRYDVVISFLTSTNIETLLAMVGLGIPTVISERNNPYILPEGKIYRFLRSVTYPLAKGYVFQTPDAQAFFSKRIQKKSVVIMNPINPQLPAVYSGEREKRVVNVGRLVPQKNHRMFIDAFREFSKSHPDYIAEIYGEGPLEKELLDYIRSSGMETKVFLRGFCKDVLSEIASSAMFVMSSDYEGMSNALIEAVGMGIPCISTDHPIGGARLTIQDGVSGFLVPVGDTYKLTEKMSNIADDPELASKFSKQGVLLRNKLSIKEIAKSWIEYIEKVRKGNKL